MRYPLLLAALAALALSSACSRAREVAGSPVDRCGRCHGQPPASGAHAVHAALLGGGASACLECHPAAAARASVHGTGRAEVVFGARAGAAATFQDGRCSGVACHGASLGRGGSNPTPSWTGGPGEASCGSCHGRAAGDPLPPAPHPQSSACGACHEGYTATAVNVALHGNGRPDTLTSHADPLWTQPDRHGWAAEEAPGPAACAGCHGADYAGGIVAVSCNACHRAAGHADWAADCTFCHGDPQRGEVALRPAPPAGVHGESASTEAAVGAHARHLSGPAPDCATCHGALPTGLGHVGGGGARLEFTGRAAGTAYLAGRCAGYCHGASAAAGGVNRAPSWTGGPGEATCGSCHGQAPGNPLPPAPHTQGQGCALCHPGYGTSTVAAAIHVDGKVDVARTHADPDWSSRDHHGLAALASPGPSACGACHGTDLSGGPTGISCSTCHEAAGVASWQSDCTFCHGTRPAGGFTWSANPVEAAPPRDASGNTLPSAPGVGAHARHLSRGVACAVCHVVPPAAAPESLAHARGQRGAVRLGGLAAAGGVAAAWDPAAGSCAVYCHGVSLAGGSAPVPAWTGGSTSCGSCHGAPPPTGAHLRHARRALSEVAYGDLRTLEEVDPQSTATDYAFGCGHCHPLDPASHLDGQVQVELAPAGARAGSLRARNAPTAAWEPASRTCSGTACHSSGQATPAFATTGTWDGGPTPSGCAACHGNPPDYVNGGAGAADANGHLALVPGPNATVVTWGHVAGLPGLRHGSAHGDPDPNLATRGEAAPLTCQACHYDTVDPANVLPGRLFYLDTTVRTSLPGATSFATGEHLCQACHDGQSGRPAGGAGRALPLRHVNGKREVVFDPRSTVPAGYQAGKVSPAPVRPYFVASAFDNLYGVPPVTAATVVDGATISFPLGEARYDPATKSCSTVACHFKDAAASQWGEGYATQQPGGCATCHDQQ